MGSRSRRERAAGLCRVRATSQSHQRAQIGTTSLSELRRISEARGIDYTAVDAALPELTLHFSGPVLKVLLGFDCVSEIDLQQGRKVLSMFLDHNKDEAGALQHPTVMGVD